MRWIKRARREDLIGEEKRRKDKIREDKRREEEMIGEDRDYELIGEEEREYVMSGDMVGGDKYKEGKRGVKCLRLIQLHPSPR